MGVLSALPFVAGGNLCCCLWLVSGGAIAAYLFQQNQSTPIAAGDGALVGLFAGLIGAVVVMVVSIPIDLFLGPMERRMLQRVFEMSRNPDLRDMGERISSRQREAGAAAFIVGHIFFFMMWLCAGAVFSTVGGLVGALIFKKQTPSGVIDIPPQA
jgi:hypothetical protein